MGAPRIACPHCKARIKNLNPEKLTRMVTCPRCNRLFRPGGPPKLPTSPPQPLRDPIIPAEAEPPDLGLPRPPRWLMLTGGLVLLAALLAGGWLVFRPEGKPAPQAKKDTPAGDGSRSGGGGKPEPIKVVPGGKCALLVGVRDYDSSKLPPLKYTENDVEGMARILSHPDSGFASVRLLTTTRGKSRRADAPTTANIRTALAALLTGRKRNDAVLVALAGHGLSFRDEKTKKDESYFCPSDTQFNDSASMIGLSDLFKQLDDSGAGVKLLLVDACRNDPRQGRSMDSDTVPRPPRGIAALFSCSSGERAWETDKLGGGHGVFFHFVLRGLLGEARDEEQEVTWARLTEFVTKKVSRTVPRLMGGGAKQTPHLVTNLTGPSPVLLRAGARWRMLLELGKEQLQQHLYAPAGETLTEAIQLAAEEPLPHAYRALALSQRNKPTDAQADCEKALALKPHLPEALAVRGRVHGQRKEFAKALADCNEAVRRNTKSALPYECRAVVRLWKKSYDGALDDCKEALVLAPRSATAHNVRGSVYTAKKKYDQALASYNQAIKLAPKYGEAFNNRGSVYLARKEIDRAIQDYDEAIRIDPFDSAAYRNRGVAYTHKKDFPRALANCNEAIKFDPLDAMAYRNRGVIHTRQEKYDQAIDDLTDALNRDRTFGLAYNDRGFAHAAKKEYDKALPDYNKAITLDPDNASAYRNRAMTYVAKGDFDNAFKDFARAIALEPAHPMVFYYRGRLYAKRNNPDKAILDFTESLRLDPNFAYAWNDRGVAYIGKRDYDKAIADFSRAIKLDPKYALAFQNRGVARVGKEQYDAAIADFSAAIRLAPDFAPPYRHRGNAYKEKGMRGLANKDLEKYGELMRRR